MNVANESRRSIMLMAWDAKRRFDQRLLEAVATALSCTPGVLIDRAPQPPPNRRKADMASPLADRTFAGVPVAIPAAPERRSVVTPGLSNVTLRKRVEATIERLITLLDAMDGDADLEPSLGSIGSSFSAERADQRLWARGDCFDREEQHDAEPDDFHLCPWANEGDQSEPRRYG